MKLRYHVASIIVACSALGSEPVSEQFVQHGSMLVGSGAIGNASQGRSVAISADGNTAIVGGPNDSNYAGAAWVWTRSGGVWTQQGTKLVGSGAVGNVEQGLSVALSADGNTALIGGPGDSSAGAAWVWTRSGGAWTQQGAKLVGSGAVGNVGQGFSVALSADGDTAIVGGTGDNSGVGAAWVWTRSGGVWTQQGTKLVGSGAVGNVGQGFSVALSADGDTAIIGGPLENGLPYGVGAAWVWTRSAGVWSQQGAKLVGSGAASSAGQGWSVALSTDGNTAVVGGPGDYDSLPVGIGAVWVWNRSGGVWSQQGTKLVGSGALPEGLCAQGSSISLSADGNTAIVGAPQDPGAAAGPYLPPSGAAWIWKRSGGVWIQQGTQLVGLNDLYALQGSSVSLSADGRTAIVGGPGAGGTGAAWIFDASDIPPRRRGVRH
ncbi:MAG TPA: hypothetical protein VLC46_00765 [Thermoanaerobaculia bacterium]|jgi:hypothetical protein|nr:hypothetical protein [Thermoanaerobaculia bacterium]